MKRFLVTFLLLLFAAAASVSAQTPDAPLTPDPIYEEDALKNLQAARTYFRPRKAYIAVIKRFDETYLAYPIFSKIDEFLYLAGASCFYLSQNKGSQKLDSTMSEDDRLRFTPESLRADADKYLSELIERFPKSKFADDARKILKELGK